MAVIQDFSQIRRLRMNELLSFSRVLEEKLRQSPFTTHEQIGRQIALFARMVQDYDDSLMGGGRWHTSEELKAADQQRDNAQSGGCPAGAARRAKRTESGQRALQGGHAETGGGTHETQQQEEGQGDTGKPPEEL